MQDVEPLVRIYNDTQEAVEVTVVIREKDDGIPGGVVFEEVFPIPARGSGGGSVDLKGTYNVSVSTPDGRRGSADMAFWYGGYFGGQMYAWITVEEGRIEVREQHAD